MIEWEKISDKTELPYKNMILGAPDLIRVKEIFWCPEAQCYWYYETCCREEERRITITEIKEYSHYSVINPPKE